MKASILTNLICAAVTTAALGQGTVNFSNLSTALSSPPDRLIRFSPEVSVVLGVPAGTPASTNVYRGLIAQLFYGASTAQEGSLVAVSTAPGSLRASTSASVGTWFGNGTRTLTGFNPGDTVNLQVRVWDVLGGSLIYGNVAGKSAVFQYTIPTNPTPAPSEFNMNNFQGFQLFFVPEPSTFTLTGLAAAAVLLFRRRK